MNVSSVAEFQRQWVLKRKNQHAQRKPLYFLTTMNDSSSKIGHDNLENKVPQQRNWTLKVRIWGTFIHYVHKIRLFSLSLLILGHQSCFLGSIIFEISQQNWHYSVHASFFSILGECPARTKVNDYIEFFESVVVNDGSTIQFWMIFCQVLFTIAFGIGSFLVFHYEDQTEYDGSYKYIYAFFLAICCKYIFNSVIIH